jgi:hypothetical protein
VADDPDAWCNVVCPGDAALAAVGCEDAGCIAPEGTGVPAGIARSSAATIASAD